MLLGYDADQKPIEDIMDYVKPDKSSGNVLVDAIMDYIEHPEKSSWYRQNVIFKQNSMPEDWNEPSKGWQINIPLINIPF